MTRSKICAYRFRWAILLVGLSCWVVAAWWVVFPDDDAKRWGLVGTPMMWGSWVCDRLGVIEGDGRAMVDGCLVIGVVLLLQWLFLAPRRGWAVEMTAVSRPMKRSILAAGFMAMLLTAGVIAGVLEFLGWWRNYFERESDAFVHWAVMIVLWGLWSAVFFVYWRQGDRYTQWGRMIRGLLAGSVLELLIAAPIQAFYHNRSNCYCARGSYTGLVFGATVVLWAFGPGVVLLFLREKYRRQRLLDRPVCFKCGYDLRGAVATAGGVSCPECGAMSQVLNEPTQG